MISNFFITAYRNFIRRKQYSLLSILVMVIGLTTALLSFLYARYEFSFDQWIDGYEHIYRLENYYQFPGGAPFPTGFSAKPAGPAMLAFFSEIEEFTRSSQVASTLKRGSEIFNDPIDYVDPNYLEFFGLSLTAGTQLRDVDSLLISAKTAEKYFGSEDAIGQVLNVNRIRDYRVVGVFEDLSDNSHMNTVMMAIYDENAFAPFFPELSILEAWNLPNHQTYIRLHGDATPDTIRERLDAFVNTHYIHPSPTRAHMTPTDFVHFGIRPISDIHLYSENIGELKPTGTIDTVLGLVAISILILIAVVINYVNLATALSTLRAKEISLRKTMGARNRQIRLQFIAEAVFLALLALAVSLMLVELFLPYFASFLNLDSDTLQLSGDPLALSSAVGIALVLGLLSGIYPAFYLSRIKPVEALSANQSGDRKTARSRALLVTLQFAVSIGLLISIFVVTRQISFVTGMDIGVETENVMVARLPTLEVGAAVPTLLEEIRKMPGVISATASTNVPSDGNVNTTSVQISGRAGEEALSAWYSGAEQDFFEVYGLEIVAGRGFSKDYPADVYIVPGEGNDLDPQSHSGHLLINETAVGFLGFDSPEEVLGFRFKINAALATQEVYWMTVVGVVPDFQFGSAYDEILPNFFLQSAELYGAISVRATPEAFNTVTDELRALWTRVLPDETLTLNPLEELIQRQYDEVGRQSQSLYFLGAVAVIISCLGIFGMASFQVERRTKEIGMRKVLGARISQIVALLLLQFSKPVVWANVIAWPVAWYLTRDWLNGFTYRIDLSAIPFMVAGLMALAIAWLIVSTHAIRAARANPVHALRYE